MAIRDVQDIITNENHSIGVFLETAGVALAVQAQDVIVEILNESSGVFRQVTVTTTKSNIDGFYKLNTVSLSNIIGNEGIYSISLGGTAIDNVFLGRFKSVSRTTVDQVNERSQEFNDDILQNIDKMSISIEDVLKDNKEKLKQIEEMVREKIDGIKEDINKIDKSNQTLRR